MSADCEFCRNDGGRVLWRESALRVVLAAEPAYPGLLRVVWNAHVREMSDLAAMERERLMAAVFAAETALREVLSPFKVNLASLGNVTPHLHWHVIARYADDAHFPQPIWSVRQRDPDPLALAQRAAKLEGLESALLRALGAKVMPPTGPSR